MSAPITVCFSMILRSSGVRRPGLFKIFSSIPIFPMSCRDDAVLISIRFDQDKGYLSVFLTSCSRIIVVNILILSTCIPLSPFRNSTISLRTLISIRLFFSFSKTWFVTIATRRRCFAYNLIVFKTRRCTTSISNGRLI